MISKTCKLRDKDLLNCPQVILCFVNLLIYDEEEKEEEEEEEEESI